MDIIIGFGSLLTLVLLIGVGLWIAKFFKPKSTLLSQVSRDERSLCPTCSTDITAKIQEKAQKYMSQSKLSVKCDCGSYSEWNVTGTPFILVGYSAKKKE